MQKRKEETQRKKSPYHIEAVGGQAQPRTIRHHPLHPWHRLALALHLCDADFGDVNVDDVLEPSGIQLGTEAADTHNCNITCWLKKFVHTRKNFWELMNYHPLEPVYHSHIRNDAIELKNRQERASFRCLLAFLKVFGWFCWTSSPSLHRPLLSPSWCPIRQ